LKEKEPEDVFVAAAKTKKIGILGGGMSGLMSSVRSTESAHEYGINRKIVPPHLSGLS